MFSSGIGSGMTAAWACWACGMIALGRRVSLPWDRMSNWGQRLWAAYAWNMDMSSDLFIGCPGCGMLSGLTLMAARCKLAGALDMLRVTLWERGTVLVMDALKEGSCFASSGAVSRRICEA